MPRDEYGALTPSLQHYAFIAVSATGTLQGIFVDNEGKQVGSAVALAITNAAPKSFADIGGGTIPAGAVGFVGSLTGGPLWVGLGANTDGTIPGGQTPGSGYARVDISPYVSFGRIGSALGGLALPTGGLTLADGLADPGVVGVADLALLFNGTTWDRVRNNVEGTALVSAARTANAPSADFTNHNCRGIIAFLNVTLASGTGGLQVSIQSKDPVSGAYKQMNSTPTAVIATGLTAYQLYPGASSAGSLTQVTSQALPRTFRIVVNVVDGSSYTYSVGFCLLD